MYSIKSISQISYLIVISIIGYNIKGTAQQTSEYHKTELSFFEPSDTLNKKRFKVAIGSVGSAYTVMSIGLYNTWYSQYPTEGFHFFDDWNEWSNMDKYGHLFSAYFQGVWGYKGAKWTGLDEDKAILTGVVVSSLFQATIEIMDGFSSKWGFSVADIGFNTLGTSAFALQQKHWGEQRIMFKVSSTPVNYSEEPLFGRSNPELRSSSQIRAEDLFGSNYLERALKDYNAQTVWASFNLNSLLQNQKIPSWLNVSLGYGAQNLLGGFENTWEENGEIFANNSPRYHQYYLSADVDLTRIKVKSPFLKTMLTLLNIFKIPAPTLQYDSLGNLKWHWLYF